MGDYGEAIRCGERALEIATGEDDLATQVIARSYLSLALQTVGDYRRAIMFARANLNTLGEAREQEWFGMALLPSVYTRTSLARALAEVGEFEEALAVAKHGISLAEAVNHSYSLMFALLGLGLVQLRRGHADVSIELLDQSLQLCRAIESPSMAALVGSFLGSAYVHAGRPGEAVGLGHDTLPRGVGLASLAEAHVAFGRVVEAADVGRLAHDIFTRMKARGYAAWALHLLANVAAGAESTTYDAAALYQQALSTAIDLGMQPLAGHCYLGLAYLHARSGDRDQAAKAAGRAQAQFAASRMPAMVEAAERVMVQ
jgi:tetratricopeptide (TPR) repeat protein